MTRALAAELSGNPGSPRSRRSRRRTSSAGRIASGATGSASRARGRSSRPSSCTCSPSSGLEIDVVEARHTSLLPRDVRDPRAARQALRPHPDQARGPDGRRATPRRGTEPLGARARPLLPHPQGRAADPRARALRRLDLRHQAPAVPLACRHAQAPALGAVRGLESSSPGRMGRAGGLGLHPRERHPVQPLHDVGYRSIGCIPCTRPTRPDEEERAGRWAGSDKLECGIHLDVSDGRGV